MTNVLSGYPMTTETNQFTPTAALIDSQAGSAFYWFVQPCKAGGKCGPLDHAGMPSTRFPSRFNSIARHTTRYSRMTSPSRGGTTSRPTSTRSGRRTGVDARIEAGSTRSRSTTDPNFQIRLETALSTRPRTPSYATRPIPRDRSTGACRRSTAASNALTWSEARTFTKASPSVELSSPIDNAGIRRRGPARWNPWHYAASYDVEVYKNGDTIGSGRNRVLAGNSKQVAFCAHKPLPGRPKVLHLAGAAGRCQGPPRRLERAWPDPDGPVPSRRRGALPRPLSCRDSGV